MLNDVIMEHERQPLDQRHTCGLESREPQGPCKLQFHIAQQLERRLKPFNNLTLLCRRLGAECEDLDPEVCQFVLISAK